MAIAIDQIVFIVSNGLIFGSILALVAVGLSLIFGTLDVPNFAQGEFASVSGFVVVGLIGIGIGLVPSIIAGIVFAFIAGITVEKLVIGKFSSSRSPCSSELIYVDFIVVIPSNQKEIIKDWNRTSRGNLFSFSS
ncbi:hypothetical protein [Halostagnicola sp. A56]|uniref:ABC transporter permease subunit n=1 Tax=Halostagnicola sp. A56 TaxID=1495067 RepID=UPI0012E29A8A|nr:hypothetical protein [Halostagnicola sp. A56]